MPSLFKRKRVIDGKTVVAKKWTVQYRGPNGKRRRVVGFTDRTKSFQLGVKLENDAAAAARLKHTRTPLSESLSVYVEHLRSKNRSKSHVMQSENRVKAILDGCAFAHLRDVNLPALEKWLASQRKAGAFGLKTSNYYARDFKSFCTWLVDNDRAEANPLSKFEPLAVTDGERERRALTADEFGKLIQATKAAPEFRTLSGTDRAALYVVAAWTGLRVGELYSLTPESFDLNGAAVTVAAAYSKRRRKDRVPLPANLVEFLNGWLPGRTGQLWPGTWRPAAAAMLKADLTLAGVPVEVAGAVCDFHALRVTYISSLAQAGVPIKTVQALARHSTITLTGDTYAKLRPTDVSDALQRLPAVPALYADVHTKCTQAPDSEGQNVASADTTADADTKKGSDAKSLPSLCLSPPVAACHGNDERRRWESNPRMTDLQSLSILA